MSKRNTILLVVLIAIILVFFIQRSGNEKSAVTDPKTDITISPQTDDKLTSQENEGGNVTVTVQPEVLGIGQKPTFKLEFNTHSVDLSFDIAKQSFLTDDKGKRLEGSTWNGSPPGGHHREGTLTFNTALTETKYVEFIMKDIAGVSKRKFKWEL
ncbi:hypothetical protein HY357_03200 [Candidatus Roizmanbacteria bacterium]|nr:hypothetical protein [Candidatus Roizmanbacteria bacterium]